MHTIIWHQVCIPKDKESLGLGDLNLRNVAALIKWWRRINKDKTILWRRILIDKYGAELLRRSQLPQNKSLSPIIQGIFKVVEEPCTMSIFSNNFKWSRRSGYNIEFWNDVWHQMGKLSHQLSILYSIASNKACAVAELRDRWFSRSDGILPRYWMKSLDESELQEATKLQKL